MAYRVWRKEAKECDHLREQLAANALARLIGTNLGMPADVPSILAPTWDQAGRVHDWRNHIPEEIRGCWGQLSPDARIVAYAFARRLAADEEWD